MMIGFNLIISHLQFLYTIANQKLLVEDNKIFAKLCVHFRT